MKECPDCKIEFEDAHVGDANGGDILVTTFVEYCPKCLYVNHYEVEISN